MNKLLAVLAGIALAGGLAACTTTSTPYQPRVAGAHVGGYSEERVDLMHWRVRFSGNSLTSRETVERYLLFRAAELTLQHGGDWFDASNKDVERRMRFESRPASGDAPGAGRDDVGYWRPHWLYHSGAGWRASDPAVDSEPWSSPPELREVDRFIATIDIEVGKGPRPEGRQVYDAKQVKAEFGPTIVRP